MDVTYNLEFKELTQAKDDAICLAYQKIPGSLHHLTRQYHGNKIFDVGLNESTYSDSLKIYEVKAVLPEPNIEDTNSWWIGNNKIMHFVDINGAIAYWNRNKYLKLPTSFVELFLEELFLRSFDDNKNVLTRITSIKIDHQFTNNNYFEPKLNNNELIITI